MRKNGIFTFCTRCVRNDARAEIFEMLKMTWFVLKIVQKVILSNFKF